MSERLANCLKRFGKALSRRDIDAIEARLEQFGGDEVAAVRDYITELQTPATLYQPQLTSVLATTVQDMNLQEWKAEKPAKGKVIWAKLKNVGKNEEKQWLGIEEWLTTDPDKKFTRQEVIDFIDANGITIEDTMSEGSERDPDAGYEWSEPVVEDDPSNYDYRVDDYVYDRERGEDDFYFDWSDEAWLEKQLEEDGPPDWLTELGVTPLTESTAEVSGPDLLGQYSVDYYDGNQRIASYPFESLDEAANQQAVYSGKGFLYNGQVLEFDELEDEVEGFQDKLVEESMDDFREVAEEAAREEYMQEPYVTYTLEHDEYDVEATGNDEIGWRVSIDNRYTDIEAYSLNEVEVQLGEQGVYPGMGGDGDGKWGEYIEGRGDTEYDNYREQKLLLPEIVDDFYHNVHFEDRNIVAFTRYTDREGGDELRIEEMQSDWDSEARRAGGYADPDFDRVAALNEKMDLEEEIRGELLVIYNDNRDSLNPMINYDDFPALAKDILGMQDIPSELKPLSDGIKNRYEKVLSAITPSINELKPLSDRYWELDQQIRVQSKAPPNQPYKANNWTNLALKYAIAEAVQGGYKQLAWSDNTTVQNLWGDRNNYSAQYDQKMPSMVKKLTGQKARHVTLDGDPMPTPDSYEVVYDEVVGSWVGVDANGETLLNRFGNVLEWSTEGQAEREIEALTQPPMGKWVIDITPDTPTEFTLMQENRGQIELLDNERVIRLGKASDVSTFLHEAGHLFLEVEKQLAEEFGETERQRTMLNWLGAESFDEVIATTPDGIKKHEQFARGFEAYLMEGNAPSLALRDAFNAFKSWLTRLYENLMALDVTLTPEIRDVFDRMLATEAEIMEATANPIYDQYFKSKEQAGMTDAEWEKYQKAVERRTNRAKETVDEQLMKEYRKRHEAEWKEEKAPLINEEYERLAKLPPYQILNDLTEYPLDYDLVMAALPGETKLPGRLIGKARKVDGVDPAEYAEVYGYDTVAEMLNEITTIPTLKVASEQAAEARMIEKYGDILNDGSLEIEVQEALHNDAQAEVLLMELRALKPKRADEINREYLKAEATRIIGEMTIREIQPNKYYRAEMRAAKRTDDPYDAKIQQLANHYLYREAVERKAQMTRWARYVKAAQKRKYDPKTVNEEYGANIRALANLYDMRQDPDSQRTKLAGILSWFNTQVKDGAVELQLIDPNLILAMEAYENREIDFNSFKIPAFEELTVSEMSGLYQMLRHLRFVGGQIAEIQQNEVAAEIAMLEASVLEHGGNDETDPETLGRAAGPWNTVRHLANKLPSLRNLIRKLDGFDSANEGAFEKSIYRLVEDSNNMKLDLTAKMHDKFVDEMDAIHHIGLRGVGMTDRLKRKYDIPIPHETTIVKQDGMKATFNDEEIFMMALYWGTESSREAIREGHGMTDRDVMKLMEKLTPDQLKLVNATWALNESMWPDLSSASFKRYGTSPEKLDPTPFVVNGVPMTGGHMRLFYNSQRLELRGEAEQEGRYATIQLGKAGSLHERVGSGGRPVLLDKNSITRAIEENIHFIAFAENGQHIRRLMNAPRVQAAIERKHGLAFHRALIEQLDQLIRNQETREVYKGLAASFKLLRKAATFRHLVFSIRNVVQQGSALPIAAGEVGPVNYINAFTRVHFGDAATKDFILEKSAFMRNRTSFVNREATEYLNKLSVEGKVGTAYQAMVAVGFGPQTYVDAMIAFPTWLAKFEQRYNEHGDERRAISDADQAVAESVGSGSDLHLGAAFNSNTSEFARTMTLFGSWFNAYFNRMYRDTQGFSNMSLEAINTVLFMPMLVAVLSSMLVMDYPDDDSDEAWWEYVLTRYVAFMGGTVPLLRDVVSVFTSGFTPKTVLAGAQESPAKLISELESYAEGRQSGLKVTSDVMKIVTTFVPVVGSGEITRIMDYIDSYNEGNEGREFTPAEAFQMLVEGPDRND